MVDFTQINDLTIGREEILSPKVVDGRVVHIDADIMAYELAGKNRFFTNTEYRRKQIVLDAKEYVNAIKYSCGAEHAVCHTTPQGSTKGARFDQALLKVYQGNRVNKEKPTDLEWAREYLGTSNNLWEGIPHYDQEADDGLAQAMYQARKNETSDLCVICSLDKDLRMLEGLHLDWRTHELQKVSQLGELYLEDNKVKGNGMKWFFFQMLAGDTADNISGIPLLSNYFLQDFLYHDQKTRKHKKCGPKTALAVIEQCSDVKDLLYVVACAYGMYGTEIGFKNYQGEDITAKEAFLSEAYLLWMRETKREKDFNRWVHENGLLGFFKRGLDIE